MDERTGTYRGVGLGDDRRAVRQEFGRPAPWDETSSIAPLGAGPVTSPQSYSCPGAARESFMRYRGVSFGLAGDRVCQLMVTARGAVTSRGVGVGDAWEKARDAHPELRCDIARIRGEHPRTFRFCAGRTADDVHLWLGGDPIDNIELTTRPVPLAGVR